MFYFAYGANMDMRVMRERGVRFYQRIPGALRGYKLLFNKVSAANPEKGLSNIQQADEKSEVCGALYEIPEEDIVKLDRKEGVPRHYERIVFPILTADVRLYEAETYIANPAMIREGLKPTFEYLNYLLVGGKDILPEDYWRELAGIETIDKETSVKSAAELS